MKKLFALLLFLTTPALAKDWKTATIIDMTETKVESPMMSGPKIILHYTVETTEYLLFLDYSYRPSSKPDAPDVPGKTSPPNLPLGSPTKISLSGHTAYLLDIHNKEIKLHIKKKTKH